ARHSRAFVLPRRLPPCSTLFPYTTLFRSVDEVDLVDGDDDVADAQSGDDGEVPASLFGRAGAGVDENDDGIGGRGACDHVARVLHVSGAVGEDARATVGGEVSVGDVVGDDLVDLVDGDDDVADAQSGDDGEVPASLFGRAGAGVDENDDGIGGRGACDHVARVLHVSGAVGEDERATVGGEVPVGDVDGDAL